MPFLVFEQDALVRNDICEALAAEFAGDEITVAETLDALQDAAGALAVPLVAILSLPRETVETIFGQSGRMIDGLRFVVIDDGPESDAARSERYVFLPRPFSASRLVASVRTALDV